MENTKSIKLQKEADKLLKESNKIVNFLFSKEVINAVRLPLWCLKPTQKQKKQYSSIIATYLYLEKRGIYKENKRIK